GGLAIAVPGTVRRAPRPPHRQDALAGPYFALGGPYWAQSSSRPARRGGAGAAARAVAPSLASRRDTGTLAVFSLMNSTSPICRLVRPSATSASTSASRGVSG